MANKTENASFEEIVAVNSSTLQIPGPIYAKIIKAALAEGDKDLPALGKAIEAVDIDSTQKISHRMKGTFGNLKLIAVASPAEAMNKIAKTWIAGTGSVTNDMGRVKELFGDVQREFEKLKQMAEDAK
ncbi:MAG: Hpt domain-containing protein [Candidatus Omnitrophica bacterium]|nr:Hpt domain-containing protein [Candidatus Omnitrophota bacterium]